MYDSLASLIQQPKDELGMFDEVDAVRTVLLPDAEEVRKGIILGVMFATEKPDKFFDDLVVEYKAKHVPKWMYQGFCLRWMIWGRAYWQCLTRGWKGLRRPCRS